MGRAEVRINDQWGTICDSAWDINAGSVLCRSLGYGTAKEVSYRGSFGRGVGPIHLTLVEYVSHALHGRFSMHAYLRMQCIYCQLKYTMFAKVSCAPDTNKKYLCLQGFQLWTYIVDTLIPSLSCMQMTKLE